MCERVCVPVSRFVCCMFVCVCSSESVCVLMFGSLQVLSVRKSQNNTRGRSNGNKQELRSFINSILFCVCASKRWLY